MELDLFKIILIVLVSSGAGFVQRVAGFGLGIFAMLFLPYLMPSGVVVVVACLLSCCTSSYNAIKYRKNIRFSTMLPPLAAALVVFSTVLPYILYTAGLAKVEAGKASIMASLEPVVAALTGVVLFSEPMGVQTLLGILCVLAGVYILR